MADVALFRAIPTLRVPPNPGDSVRPRLTLLFLVCSFLAVAAPAAAQDQPVSNEQVPLEVRPAQGPPGSSAILLATGFGAAEQVRIVFNGTLLPTADNAYEDGTVGFRIPMPDAIGVHRVVLTGATTNRTALGTFTTTTSDGPRPAIAAAPRPLVAGPNTQRPWLAEIFAVNFDANAALTLRCPCADDGYQANDFATTDASGDATETFDFFIGDFGMVDIGMSVGSGLGGTIVASDAVMKPDTGYSPTRRVRAVPPVNRIDGRGYLVGSGFTPGADITVDEDGTNKGTVKADAFGAIVATDDDGPSQEQNPTTSTRLIEGDARGAIGTARSGATLQPTAGVTLDLVPAQRTTRLVAVGLPGSTPVSIRGLDSAGKEAVLAVATTTAGGELEPVTVKIPRFSVPGPYRLEVDAGSGRAYVPMAVTGPVDPEEVSAPKPTILVDAEGDGTTPIGEGGSQDETKRSRTLTITLPKKMRIASLAKSGVKVSVDLKDLDCARSCAVSAQLRASSGPAKLLGAKGKAKELTVTSTKSTARRTTKAALRLKLSKRGAARLRRMRKITFRVKADVVDGAGVRAGATRSLLATRR